MDDDGFPFCFFYRPILLFLVVASHFDTRQTRQMSMKLSQSRMVWSLPVHFLRKLHGRQKGKTAMVFDECWPFCEFFSSNNCLGAWNDEKNDDKDIFFLWFWRGTYSKLWYGWRKSNAMILSWLKTVNASIEICGINCRDNCIIQMFPLSSISSSEHKQTMNHVEWHFQKLVPSRYLMCAIVWQCCLGLWNLHPVYVWTFFHSFLCYFIMR